MIKKLLFSLILLITSICGSEAKNALVVIAHGSPIESWCKLVLNREDTVRNKSFCDLYTNRNTSYTNCRRYNIY